MYKHILIPVDNSRYSNYGMDLGISLAKKFDSQLVCSHVYAARLHDSRFKEMEKGLPSKYQDEKRLEETRNTHDTLITKGLQIISESYLDLFEKRCREAQVQFERKIMEGKNFVELVNEVRSDNYDLVVMGALGLGAVEGSLIGSVCERVVRRINTDVLVVKNQSLLNGTIIVAIDGSSQSMAGLKIALNLGKAFGVDVEAISAFDPNFHYTAFRSLKGVLSDEAGKIFKLEEQEKLHEEIIDNGLAEIYQEHLNTASRIAEREGVKIKTKLLSGKPFNQVLKYVKSRNPSLLIVGKVGIHCNDGLDIGSTTENLLRLAPCHVLITSGRYNVPLELKTKKPNGSIPWTDGAKKRLENVPAFAREMAKKAIEDYGRKKGHKEINLEVMEKARKRIGM